MKQQREDIELINSILFNTKDKSLSEKELYQRYYKVAYNKVRKYNYDDESAKDIATDILLKIFGSLEKYNSDKCSFNSWVLKISSNHLIDLFRKNKNGIKFISYNSTVTTNTTNFSYETCTTTLPTSFNMNSNSTLSNAYIKYVTTTNNQEDEFINKENYNNAINSLNELESNIIRLKYEYGYSNEEIGQLYNVPKSTVSNKINYLKKKMQKSVKNENF